MAVQGVHLTPYTWGTVIDLNPCLSYFHPTVLQQQRREKLREAALTINPATLNPMQMQSGQKRS
jgi:hypothetical protein